MVDQNILLKKICLLCYTHEIKKSPENLFFTWIYMGEKIWVSFFFFFLEIILHNKIPP